MRGREFEPLGAVIGRIKADVERAIRERDEEAGVEAHLELVDLEHRQRVVQTVRKHAK